MQDIIKKHGLSTAEMAEELKRGIGVKRIEVRGEKFLVANNDTVLEARGMKENSVDLIVSSIPFANHYEYSPNYCDMGHTDDNNHFWAQMDYLTPELMRILKPGRMYCCHVKDRILFGNVTGKGAPTVSPFHMEAAFHAMKHGFDYMGMITVVTALDGLNSAKTEQKWASVLLNTFCCSVSRKLNAQRVTRTNLSRKARKSTAVRVGRLTHMPFGGRQGIGF